MSFADEIRMIVLIVCVIILIIFTNLRIDDVEKNVDILQHQVNPITVVLE